MKIISLISCILISYRLTAQPIDSALEIRLELIRQGIGNSPGALALGVSVINHSDQDLYVPDLEQIALYGGIHYYYEDGGQWKELDILTKKDKTRPAMRQIGNLIVDSHDIPTYKENNITKDYVQLTLRFSASQDSILVDFLHASGKGKSIRLFEMRQPLFIKAKQELDRIAVYNIDYFMDQPKRYKIDFELPDYPKFISADSTLDAQHQFYFPLYIFSYRRSFPNAVQSNTLYFSTAN